MKGNRVINFRRDSCPPQEFPQFIPFPAPNGKLVIHVTQFHPGDLRELHELRRFRTIEERSVAVGSNLAPPCPIFEVAELDSKDGSLQRVQTAVHPQNFMMIFLFAAMHAQQLQPFSE